MWVPWDRLPKVEGVPVTLQVFAPVEVKDDVRDVPVPGVPEALSTKYSAAVTLCAVSEIDAVIVGAVLVGLGNTLRVVTVGGFKSTVKVCEIGVLQLPALSFASTQIVYVPPSLRPLKVDDDRVAE